MSRTYLVATVTLGNRFQLCDEPAGVGRVHSVHRLVRCDQGDSNHILHKLEERHPSFWSMPRTYLVATVTLGDHFQLCDEPAGVGRVHSAHRLVRCV